MAASPGSSSPNTGDANDRKRIVILLHKQITSTLPCYSISPFSNRHSPVPKFFLFFIFEKVTGFRPLPE
jgi:hypothetical protein